MISPVFANLIFHQMESRDLATTVRCITMFVRGLRPGYQMTNDRIIVIFSEDTIEVLCGCQASIMSQCTVLWHLASDIGNRYKWSSPRVWHDVTYYSWHRADVTELWHSLLTVAWQHFLTWGETWPLHWTQSRSVVCISVSQQCCSLLGLSPCNS